MSEEPNVEPWLRGPLNGVDGAVMPVFFSFQQVREDLRQHIGDLTREQIWRRIGNTSIGFHLKHIAGSVSRLSTYLANTPLSDEQFKELRDEKQEDADVAELLDSVHYSLLRAEEILRSIQAESFHDARFVGRQRLPTTVLGLLVHLAEHTQRHLGQAIVISQVVRLLGAAESAV